MHQSELLVRDAYLILVRTTSKGHRRDCLSLTTRPRYNETCDLKLLIHEQPQSHERNLNAPRSHTSPGFHEDSSLATTLTRYSYLHVRCTSNCLLPTHTRLSIRYLSPSDNGTTVFI
jgi:hypothetical protein